MDEMELGAAAVTALGALGAMRVWLRRRIKAVVPTPVLPPPLAAFVADDPMEPNPPAKMSTPEMVQDSSARDWEAEMRRKKVRP